MYLTGGALAGSAPDLPCASTFPGESGLPPVFFSSLALLKITVNPSADVGSLTSHSPNFGNGRPLSYKKKEQTRCTLGESDGLPYQSDYESNNHHLLPYNIAL